MVLWGLHATAGPESARPRNCRCVHLSCCISVHVWVRASVCVCMHAEADGVTRLQEHHVRHIHRRTAAVREPGRLLDQQDSTAGHDQRALRAYSISKTSLLGMTKVR